MTTYTLMYHDEETEGSVHHPYNFSYADQATRKADTSVVTNDIKKLALQDSDGSGWRLSGISPTTWDPITPPSPVVGDIGKVLKVVTDGDSGVMFSWETDAAGGDLDAGYNAFGGAGIVTIDAGALTWALDGAYDFVIDVDNAGGGNGFKVENASGGHFFRVYHNTAGGNDRLFCEYTGTLLEMYVDETYIYGTLFEVETTDQIYLHAEDYSEFIVSGVTQDLLLGARGATINLNEASNESLSGDFTKSSIIGALNELMALYKAAHP